MTQKIKLLIIDDDADIVTIIRYCFANTPNIDLFYAYSGEEGLKMAIEHEPHIILLDVLMPNMDGIATLKALRLLPKTKKTCVIFLTAKAQCHEIKEYLQMGVFDVITKPFDPLTLANEVLTLYDRYTKQNP